jgi:SPP1 gp7 family putative phage head morphogenesis protein
MKKVTERIAKTQNSLDPVRPNAGIDAWYQRILDHKIQKMHRSYFYWLQANWRAQGLSMDAAPAKGLAAELQRLSRQWQNSFNTLASWMSVQMAERVMKATDAALDSRIRSAGFHVRFVYTKEMKDAFAAVVNEQVSLIKSIPSQYATEVQGLVMRSVARGRDISFLKERLEKRFHITRRRAALIARDQNNKATATLQATRQKAIGFTKGIWMHSHAGKHPRPSHVAADGVEFELNKGLYLEGEWVLPGEAINCRCTWRPVIPGFKY